MLWRVSEGASTDGSTERGIAKRTICNRASERERSRYHSVDRGDNVGDARPAKACRGQEQKAYDHRETRATVTGG